MKTRLFTLAIAFCPVIWLSCGSNGQISIDEISSVIKNVRSEKTDERRTSIKKLCYVSIDEETKEKIADKHLEELITLLNAEDDGVVKYWLITFIGNLGKYSEKAVVHLEKIARDNSSDYEFNKRFTSAIPVALKKIKEEINEAKKKGGK